MYKAKTNVWGMNYTDNFEKVCSYLEKTGGKLMKIKRSYNEVKEVIKKYIEITNTYSAEVTALALKLFPSSNSVEGKLIQSIQSILLFSTEAIDNFVRQVQIILKNFKASKESNSSGLDDLSKIYQINFSTVVRLYCTYITESELYEKYLIHKELGILDEKNKINEKIDNNDKNEKKQEKVENNDNNIEKNIDKNQDNTPGNKQENESFNFVILDTENIQKELYNNKIKDKNQEIKSKKNPTIKDGKESGRIKEENKKTKEIINKKETNKEEKDRKGSENGSGQEKKQEDRNRQETSNESLYDNHDNIIKCEKEYINFVKEANIFIKKLVEFGFNEEKILKSDFYNNCNKFVEKLLECVEMQMKKYQDQSNLIKDLNEQIKSEKIENFFLESQKYSLHSLSIYMNKKTLKKNDELRQKGEFDNELYKQLEIENIGNIIDTMQKNGITVKQEDLDNYEREKNIAFIENNIQLIFSNDSNMSEEGKNKIMEFFKKDKEYILFFLQKMNNDRSRGGKIVNLQTYHCIGELFRFINNITLDKNDFDCFKYIAILSMTYYRMEGEKKLYIYEYIKDHPSFQNLDFWTSYLETLINYDINNHLYKNKKAIAENGIDEKEEQFKLKFASFSNVLTVMNNMTDFGLKKGLIENFINIVNNKYSFNDEEKKQFTDLLDIYEEKNSNENTPTSQNIEDKIKEKEEDTIAKKDIIDSTINDI